MAENKKSIIKEALADYNELVEAAKNKAKNDLANEFPDKFNNLIKEEMKNKKTIKESYKKINTEESINLVETEIKTTPIMEKKNETKKVVKENFEPQQTEEFNISELDMSSVGSALEGAGANDEVITMNEIEDELASLDLGGDPQSQPSMGGDGSMEKLYELQNQLQEVINGLGSGNEFDIKKLGETSITEEETISDADIDSVIGGEKEPQVDEAHGVSYTARRASVAGKNLPGQEYLSAGEKDQSPAYMNENKNKTKISNLIKENASLTKKLNEAKKYKDTAGGLIESYNVALGKYRNQLKEMAVFNTNLAHVNNLLVNEDLALTQNDKVRLINEFKSINSISDSQSKYKTFLTEMKESRKTLTESIEDKVSTTIQPSSKQKLDEVVVKTGFQNDAHMNKMLKIIKTIENRGKK